MVETLPTVFLVVSYVVAVSGLVHIVALVIFAIFKIFVLHETGQGRGSGVVMGSIALEVPLLEEVDAVASSLTK